tara:strand:+ start:437 stop:793 length:357 start_codon:yes stop_codon:yes gene_type:complete
MSTITVTNIKATGQTASRDTSGVAGAYGNFDQTTNAARGYSQNISSYTDAATGKADFNFTNAFSDEHYVKAGIASSSDDYMSWSTSAATSSASRMQNREEGTGFSDAINQVIFHGDLA